MKQSTEKVLNKLRANKYIRLPIIIKYENRHYTNYYVATTIEELDSLCYTMVEIVLQNNFHNFENDKEIYYSLNIDNICQKQYNCNIDDLKNNRTEIEHIRQYVDTLIERCNTLLKINTEINASYDMLLHSYDETSDISPYHALSYYNISIPDTGVSIVEVSKYE